MLKYLCLITFCVAACSSYNILAVLPVQIKSHFKAFEPLLLELSARGHNVTVITHFPGGYEIPGYEEISLEGVTDILVDKLTWDTLSTSRMQKYLTARMVTGFCDISCRTGLSSPKTRDLITSNRTFDLVLVEFFASNCFLGLLEKFPAPLIGLSSCLILSWMNKFFGNPDNPAYVPLSFMDYSVNMSFLERAENAMMRLANEAFYQLWSVRHARDIVMKSIGVDSDVEAKAYNASLLLLNTHFTISQSRPFVPSIIEVGGVHIGKRGKLPGNIEKWINESREGVIYFSMGSMIKGHTFPEDKRQAFLRAFGRLKQRVLWKWENDTMPGKPDNVMIQKWMPQFDILCHPNVKAFISHGGLLGTTEAVHCGVPVVVMPQFGDQHTNARALEAGGGGVVLNFRDVDEDSVYNALRTVLDPKFNKQAKELSERFRDRPMPPMETAIYWIEYVARHKGAHHMRTAAVGMPFYQYLLLDVIAFLSAIIFLTLYIFYKATKAILRKLFGKREKVKKN